MHIPIPQVPKVTIKMTIDEWMIQIKCGLHIKGVLFKLKKKTKNKEETGIFHNMEGNVLSEKGQIQYCSTYM